MSKQRLTRKELGKACDLSPAWVSALVDQGHLRRGDDGKFDPWEALADLSTYYRHMTGTAGLAREKIAKQVELLQLSVEREARDLIPRDRALAAWERIKEEIASRMKKLPGELAPRVARCGSETHMEQIINEAIELVLLETSRLEILEADIVTP